MTYYSMRNWKIIKVAKSTRKNKKYLARIRNKKTKETAEIHFGDTRFFHFFDRTPTDRYYTYLNHNDKERRKRYIARHMHFIKPGYYSAGYMALTYLW